MTLAALRPARTARAFSRSMWFLPGTPMAVDATAMAGRSLRFDAAAKRCVRGVQQRPAAAEMIRASVKNRVDNGVPGASVAIHGRRRSERSRAVLLTVACRGANSRSASPTAIPSTRRRRFIGRACGTARSSDAALRTNAKRFSPAVPALRTSRSSPPPSARRDRACSSAT